MTKWLDVCLAQNSERWVWSSESPLRIKQHNLDLRGLLIFRGGPKIIPRGEFNLPSQTDQVIITL